MNRREEERLIVALLSGRDPAAVRDASLELALSAARHETRRRRAIRSVLRGCALALTALLLLALFVPPPRPTDPSLPAPAPLAGVPVVGVNPIETIDDQQLLALLPGKTVALIGPPGRAQLFVFETPVRSSVPANRLQNR